MPQMPQSDIYRTRAAGLAIELAQLKAVNARLVKALGVVLGDIDFTNNACGVTEMVGAVLKPESLKMAQDAFKAATEG